MCWGNRVDPDLRLSDAKIPNVIEARSFSCFDRQGIGRSSSVSIFGLCIVKGELKSTTRTES